MIILFFDFWCRSHVHIESSIKKLDYFVEQYFTSIFLKRLSFLYEIDEFQGSLVYSNFWASCLIYIFNLTFLAFARFFFCLNRNIVLWESTQTTQVWSQHFEKKFALKTSLFFPKTQCDQIGWFLESSCLHIFLKSSPNIFSLFWYFTNFFN